MLTIFSALGGLASSLLPDLIHGILGQRQDARDKAQELAILDKQIALQAAGHAGRMEELGLQADIAESAALEKRVTVVGVRWVDALNASVRPVVTYCFFALFATQLIARIVGNPVDPTIWSEEVQALFAGIMGYYFGNRSVKHARGK